MPEDEITEAQVTLALVLGEDDGLRRWFLDLGPLPAPQRRLALSDMAIRMRGAGVDPRVASAISSLARPEVYEAVRRSVDEISG